MNDMPRFKLLGSSPIFQQTLLHIQKMAKIDATVVIAGETGMGKELAARAIHYACLLGPDRRGQQPLRAKCRVFLFLNRQRLSAMRLWRARREIIVRAVSGNGCVKHLFHGVQRKFAFTTFDGEIGFGEKEYQHLAAR